MRDRRLACGCLLLLPVLACLLVLAGGMALAGTGTGPTALACVTSIHMPAAAPAELDLEWVPDPAARSNCPPLTLCRDAIVRLGGIGTHRVDFERCVRLPQPPGLDGSARLTLLPPLR